MRRHLAALVTVLVAAVSTAAPASAADELGISADGVTFAPTFHGPLFDSAIRWVPGDTRSATFYVRNQGGTPARMTVDVLSDHIGDLLDSGDVRITASAKGESGTSTDGVERLITLPQVADGEVVPVTVVVDFDWSSPNDTQVRSSDFRFRVNLSQTSAVLGEEEGETNGPLPDTGAPELWVLALGSALLGTGVAIRSRRRETQQGESHV